MRNVVVAFDPFMLPLFLELGSILFFSAAFSRTISRETVRISPLQLVVPLGVV
jgi:hypothetical protein